MPEMTDQRLREIEKRANKAKPDPWVYDLDPDDASANFFLNVTRDVPDLVAEVRRLRNQVDRIRAIVDIVDGAGGP